MMLSPRQLRILLAALALLILLAGPGLAPDSSFLQRPEQQLYDWRMRLNLQSDQDPRVVIVDIDEASLGKEGRWPWPRERLATLVDQLFNHYGISILGFDMVFAESDRLAGLARIQSRMQDHYPLLAEPLTRMLAELDPDLQLARSFEGLPVVLGYTFGNQQNLRTGALPSPLAVPDPGAMVDQIRTAPGYSANLALLQQYADGGGFFDNPLIDSDGVYRRVPMLQRYEEAFYPSLSLAVMQSLFGSNALSLHGAGKQGTLEQLDLDGLKIPVDPQGAVLVPYRGRQGSFPYVSASDVLDGSAAAQTLEGAIVLVGTSAAGLLDLRATPVQNAYAGVEVHANLIAAMLDETLLSRPDYMRGANLLQCLIIGLLMVFVPTYLGALWSLLVAGLLGALVVGGNLMLWQQAGHVLPLAPPLLVLIVLYALQQLLGYAIETRRHQRLNNLFGQYVPPALVDEMQSESSDFGMSGESRQMTVLFSDIRGFTTLSEKLTPRQLTRLMNIYLSPMTEVIHEYRGTIDKYIGDAVMAFWGAPLSDPQHARHALQGAMAMLAHLPALNRELAAEGLPPVKIGIGLNSGEMSVGNMGSRFRMAYTVLGDAVNLGSRLEGLTKYYGVELVVSEGLVAQVPDHPFRLLDRVRVKGKQEAVAIYEPLVAGDSCALELLDIHQRAMDCYQQQAWDEAERLFCELENSALGPHPYPLYRQRIRTFQQQPPGGDWDGVHTLESK